MNATRAKTFRVDQTQRKKRSLKRTKSASSPGLLSKPKADKVVSKSKSPARGKLPRTKSSSSTKTPSPARGKLPRTKSSSSTRPPRKLSVPSLTVHETLTGHEDQITAILVTKSGLIVTGSDDSVVRIWENNAGTWSCSNTLKGHRERVKGLCLFKERWIISASFDKSIRVWSLKGKHMKVLEGHDLQVLCVAPMNESLIVSGSADRTLRLWNVKTGKTQKILKGHTQAVECVCAGRNVIVSGSSDKTVRIWDQRRCITTLRGHTGWVTCVTMNKTHIFSGAQDNTVRVWSIKTKESLHVLKKHRFWVLDVAVCGDMFLTASVDNTVRTWDLRTMQSNSVLKCETAVNCCSLNDDFIATGGKDGEVKIFSRKPTKSKSSTFPGTSISMEGDAENDPGVWEALLHMGIGMQEIAEYLHTDDLLAYARKLDSVPLVSLIEGHGFQLETCHTRVKSLLNPGGDIWPCCGSKTGFMKFPTEVVFMKGEVFDGEPKIGMVLYDNRWAGTVPQHQGGAVQLYIFDKRSLKNENWFDKNHSPHANACRKAFGAFPSGPYLRGEFGFKDGELNFCFDNAALFPFPVNSDSVEMPYPLQRHLQLFWEHYYSKGIGPNEDQNLAIKFDENQGEHWFSFRKQLSDADAVALVNHEQKTGLIHPDLYDIRKQQRGEIDDLNEQACRLQTEMTELEENALEVKCKYKSILESYKRDERANKRSSASPAKNEDLVKEVEKLKNELKVFEYKNRQLERHVELLAEQISEDSQHVKKFISGKLGEFECISLE